MRCFPSNPNPSLLPSCFQQHTQICTTSSTWWWKLPAGHCLGPGPVTVSPARKARRRECPTLLPHAGAGLAELASDLAKSQAGGYFRSHLATRPLQQLPDDLSLPLRRCCHHWQGTQLQTPRRLPCSRKLRLICFARPEAFYPRVII